MSNQLFAPIDPPEYLLDIKYHGPSFDGVIGIEALQGEIGGLEVVINTAIEALARHKRIGFDVEDAQILVAAFEKSSFSKKILLSLRGINEYQGVISLGAVLVGILTLIQQAGADQVRELSPKLMAEIGDQVKVELLQDPAFLKGAASIVKPLSQTGDELICKAPEAAVVEIKYNDKDKFLELSGDSEVKITREERVTLRGRINRVDLDATRRHLGFKIKGEGSSISSTLSDGLKESIDMGSLLGRWVEIEAVVSTRNEFKEHLSIESLKFVQQQEIKFPEAQH